MKRAQTPRTYAEGCAMMLEAAGKLFAALAESTAAPTEGDRQLYGDIGKACLSLASEAPNGRAPAKGKRAA